MITIEQLKAMPVGEKVGGFDLNIKTHKKIFQMGKKWFQKVCLVDETGDMLADVNITSGTGHIPLNSQRLLHITVCEVQESEDALHLNAGKCGKKLLVHEHRIPDVVSWDGETSQEVADWMANREAEIKGKIACLWGQGFLSANHHAGELKAFIEDPRLWEAIEYITPEKIIKRSSTGDYRQAIGAAPGFLGDIIPEDVIRRGRE